MGEEYSVAIDDDTMNKIREFYLLCGPSMMSTLERVQAKIAHVEKREHHAELSSALDEIILCLGYANAQKAKLGLD